MATTTNFGWETPDDTDLVKDGALAMRTLGNAIDASLVDLKGGTTGQVLSKTSNTDMDFTWVTSDDANAIQNAIVDAKGDLITATAADTPARLAVGSNGDTLVADSSATTGLRWQGNYAAGKQKLINADFNIWQRGTSFSLTSTGAYTADRWKIDTGGSGVCSVTRQTFTVGQTDVPGNPTYFLQAAFSTSGSSSTLLQQPIENVSTFAGQTITYSLWAKVSSGTVAGGFQWVQDFGSGGSSTEAGYFGSFTLTTSWQRISATVTLPSISGKTVGTGSSLTLRFSPFTTGTVTYSLANAQAELGSVATAFQTATGTLQGELAACQRYYWRRTGIQYLGAGHAKLTTAGDYVIQYPVEMRIAPSLATNNGTNYFGFDTAVGLGTANTIGNFYDVSTLRTLGRLTCTGLTAGQGGVGTINNAAGYLEASAEL